MLERASLEPTYKLNHDSHSHEQPRAPDDPDREQLAPEQSLKLATHSLSGFEWGYAGSGPAQFALALLLDYTDDEEVALAEYMEFKAEIVSQLDCTGPDGC